MNATTPQANVQPSAFVIFDSASPRTPRPFFGHGLFRSSSVKVMEPSRDDRQWWAAESARLADARELAELNAEVESMAEDARQFQMYMDGMDFTSPDAHAASRFEECELASVFGRDLYTMMGLTA